MLFCVLHKRHVRCFSSLGRMGEGLGASNEIEGGREVQDRHKGTEACTTGCLFDGKGLEC